MFIPTKKVFIDGSDLVMTDLEGREIKREPKGSEEAAAAACKAMFEAIQLDLNDDGTPDVFRIEGGFKAFTIFEPKK